MPLFVCVLNVKEKTTYEWLISDRSSDVCSSDLRSAPDHVKPKGKREASGGASHLISFFVDIAQHIAATPDRLDINVALAGQRQLFAELADKDVDDLQLGLVHPEIGRAHV